MKALRLILAAALCLAMAPVHATQLAKFGDWTVSTEEDFIDASTENDMKENVGLFCFHGQPDCRWGFTLYGKCLENKVITAIVSNEKDSVQMPMACMGSEDKQSTIAVLKVEEFEKLIAKGKSYFTVDFGVSGGVHRFSLKGANKAIADARKRAKSVAGKN